MEYIFDFPWELGMLLGIAMAFALDLGRRLAVRYHIEQIPNEKSR